MQIIFKYDEKLFSIFPEAKKYNNDHDILVKEIKNYFSYGPFKPQIKFENNLVIIDIDTPAIYKHDKDYQKVVDLCTKGKYNLAKPILTRLIKENPTVSEYHRIYGQILSDEGNQDQAIDKIIDALRWDPDNVYALLMMGNIYAKFKNDIKTATLYYDYALAADRYYNLCRHYFCS
jgi:tetratricopeptide (TPR) repeat protein